MPSTTVRIRPADLEALKALAFRKEKSVQKILSEAVEAYRRQCFLEELSRDFAVLRSDPTTWKDELRERRDWDSALADDLEDE